MSIVNVRAIINPGDLFAALPALKQYREMTKNHVRLLLWLNRKATYFEGAVHPTVDKDGYQVTMNETVYEAVRPLLMQQPYIADVQPWNGEEYKFALDEHLHFNMNKWIVNLSRLFFYIFPDLACDLSKPWLTVPYSKKMHIAKGEILVARTQRYLNPNISYHFLKDYDNVMFVGLKQEWEIFCKEYNLDIPWLQTETFLELAQAIQQAKFLVSNQTSIFWLAEAMKTPRILEVNHTCPNVHVTGANGYDFMYQAGLDYYFKLLNK